MARGPKAVALELTDAAEVEGRQEISEGEPLHLSWP